MLDNSTISLSKLTYEPLNIPEPPDCEYGFWRSEDKRYHFCRFFVEQRLFSECATFFTASDSIIERHANVCYPFFGDGSGYILARRVGEYVLWMAALEALRDYPFGPAGLREDDFYIFEATQYAEAIPFGNVQDIPELSVIEIQAFLKIGFPALQLLLYVTPEISGDARGVKLVRRVQETLFAPMAQIRIVPPPEKYTQYHIGLDLQDFVECVWRIGRNTQEICVQFLSQPHFPLWLGGEVVQETFKNIHPAPG